MVKGIKLDERNSLQLESKIIKGTDSSNRIHLFTDTIQKGNPPKEEKSVSESFKTVWDYIKFPFIKIWEYIETPVTNFWNWIKWVVQGCPKVTSCKEAVTSIVTDPKKSAKEYAISPIENIANLIVATLLDKTQITKMRKDSTKKWETFLKTFIEKVPDYEKYFKGEKGGLIQALRALLNPTIKSKNDFFSKLKGIVQQNPSLFQRSLTRLSEKILEVIGKEEKKNNKDIVKHLRIIFNDYIPKTVQFLEEHPEKFGPFIDALYSLEKIESDKVLPICEKYLFPPASYQESLKEILQNPAHLSKQLNSPNLFIDPNLKTTAGMEELPMAFYQCVVEEIRPDEIDTFISVIKAPLPLLAEVLEKIRDLEKEEKSRLVANLPDAIKELSKLKKELDDIIKNSQD